MADKLAFIGDEDTVLGFGALGMDCFIVEDRSAGLAALKKLDDTKYAVVFLTDEAAEMMGEEIARLAGKILFMTIPSCRSRKQMGLQEITGMIEKAVGIANIMDKT